MEPRKKKLYSRKMNPDRTDKKSTFQIANNKLPGQNLRQHKTILIIQSTCAREISDDY